MNKDKCPDDEVIRIKSDKLKVCGHPVRLKLLCLIENSDCCVSELWKCLDQPQPVISQHLAVLKEKGIVESRVDGNRRFYAVVDPFIKNMLNSCKE